MIQFEDVSKVYRTAQGEVRALDGLTLHVARGEFVAVKGHSGSGKSTLLALTAGLALPTSGKVRVNDQDLSRLTVGERARFRSQNIGFVFQMFHLLPYLTVLENVLVAAPADGGGKATQQARDLMSRFGLNERGGHRPGQLSAGERQRVAMARALLNQPPLLLADEPTGNLDPQNSQGVLDLLNEFHAGGGTVLLVTHDEQVASGAQRTIVLERGRVKEGMIGESGGGRR